MNPRPKLNRCTAAAADRSCVTEAASSPDSRKRAREVVDNRQEFAIKQRQQTLRLQQMVRESKPLSAEGQQKLWAIVTTDCMLKGQLSIPKAQVCGCCCSCCFLLALWLWLWVWLWLLLWWWFRLWL